MLFSSPITPEVGLLKSLLDGAGIACEIRNEISSSNFPGAPFQPEIWILNENDYAEACQIRDAWCNSLPAEPSLKAEKKRRSARTNLFFCASTGSLLLVLGVIAGARFVHAGNWDHLIGALLLFGLGSALIWAAVGYWRNLPKG